jgi:hypothetical protein
MRGRWHLKRIFQRLIQDRDPPLKMWNIIIKPMICLYMGEFIYMIKLPLNNLFILGGFKKKHISVKNELLIYLIIKMICLGGILVPQEYALLTPCTKLVYFLLRNQGIAGGTKKPKVPYRRNVAILHFIRSPVPKSMIWIPISHIYCTENCINPKHQLHILEN